MMHPCFFFYFGSLLVDDACSDVFCSFYLSLSDLSSITCIHLIFSPNIGLAPHAPFTTFILPQKLVANLYSTFLDSDHFHVLLQQSHIFQV